MFSGFMHRKQVVTANSEAKRQVRERRIITTATTNSPLYTSQSAARTNQWIQQNINTRAASILAQGSSELLHPDHHQFRNNSPIGSVYVRKYVPEKARVLLTSTQYFHEHYIQEPFNEEEPCRSKAKWLRPRNRTAEIKDRMTFNHAHENERIAKVVSATAYSREPIDPKQLTDPKWRQSNKTKFITQKGFDCRLRTSFKGKFDQQVWPCAGEYAMRTEYKGGFEETGKFLREREKEKEVSKRCFSSSSPKDIWRERLNTSMSIRKYVSDKAMEEIVKNEKTIHVQDERMSQQNLLTPKTNEKSHEIFQPYEKIEEKKEEHEVEESIKRRAATVLRNSNGRVRVRTVTNAKFGSRGSDARSNEKIREPKSEAKVYKKSLENYYSSSGNHPMKESRLTKETNFWQQFNTSSSQILKKQLSHEHWSSGFKEGIDSIEQRLKLVRNVKTPVANFRQPEDFYRLSKLLPTTEKKRRVKVNDL